MNPLWYTIGLAQGMTYGGMYDNIEIGPIGETVIVVGLLAMIVFVIMFVRFMRTW